MTGALQGEVPSTPCATHRSEPGPQVAAAVRNFAAEGPDAAADLHPCGIPAKAAGCPSWGGAGNASVGRDGAVPGAPLRARLLRGRKRPRPRPWRRSAPCLRSSSLGSGHCPSRPALPCPSLPGQKLPSRLLFRNDPFSFREPAGKQRRGGPGASGVPGGGPPPPFLSRGDHSVPGHGTRKTPAFPLGFSCEEGELCPSSRPGSRSCGSRGEGQALLLRLRPPRVRPMPLAGGEPRAVPSSLWKRFPGCLLARSPLLRRA